MNWDPAKHPRKPKGTSEGGEFARSTALSAAKAGTTYIRRALRHESSVTMNKQRRASLESKLQQLSPIERALRHESNVTMNAQRVASLARKVGQLTRRLRG